jgi:hypothetical protein
MRGHALPPERARIQPLAATLPAQGRRGQMIGKVFALTAVIGMLVAPLSLRTIHAR